MKNNKLFNKSFILVTILFTAFVVLASCSNAASPKATKKNNLDSPAQGIVVSGSFTFDGMFATDASAGRSAAPSFSEYNVDDYYGEVSAYACTMVQMGGGKDGPITYTTQKNSYPSFFGTVNLATKKWRIAIPYSGTYVMEVQLYKMVDGSAEEVSVLIGESSAETIVFDADTISSHLNGSIAWPGELVSLLPNPLYTDKTRNTNVGDQYYTEASFSLKFRYPSNSSITSITSHVTNCYFNTASDDVEVVSDNETEEGYTLLTVTGTQMLNKRYANNSYNSGPIVYEGSGSDFIEFKNSAGKTLYTCTESISLIPGFTTDTWYWDDENDPHYYKDSEGVTYFNITQEMLDNYAEKEIYNNSSGYNNEESYSSLPVILFDNDSSSYGYSVFDSISENAALTHGLTLANGRKVLDFAIAPIDSNDNIAPATTRHYYYTKTTQQIFTIEADSSGKKVLVMYPSYAGYDSGEVIATVGDASEDVLSVFAAYDGYIYLLLGTKELYVESVTAIKRVCVKQNESFHTRDENFGSIQNFTFYRTVGGDQQNVNIGAAISFENTTVRGYKLTAYNYMNERSYMYLSYIYDSEKLYCQRITIPVNTNDETISLNVTQGSSAIVPYYMDLKTMTNESSYLKFSEAYVSDATIALTGLETTSSQGNITIFNGDLYIAIHAPSGTFGGIVKISDIASSTKSWSYTNADFCEKIGSDTDSPRIRGWYPSTTDNTPYSATDEKLYFYGPSKFIARKPDELVIADEKSYEYTEDGQNKGYNGDRVVKINLANFANPDSPMDVIPVSTKFSWKIEVTCDGTNYIEY
ncbi:MAG: hypothetical protein J6X78_05035 [Treponema sp.]|nr:hypothetical protein [Treponema sp.]